MIINRTFPTLLLGAFCLALLPLGAGATEIPVDDTNFDADPPGEVTFNPDGSATMTEDDFFGIALLFNAPASNPEVIEALPNTVLSFSYDFTIGPADTGDIFRAVLLESGLATPFELVVDMA